MEQRWNVRTPLELDVTIHVPDKDPVPGTTLDMSFGGMHVQVGPEVVLHGNTLVDVTVAIGERLETASALVVRSTQEGFGLMFTDLGHQMLTLLHTVADGTTATHALEIPAFTLADNLA
jgi:c-di-GMP-binding flagellar brake protein YcgR